MPDAYRHHHVVAFDETNLVGNVYFASHVHWQGHCRELFLRDHAPGIVRQLQAGLALVTVQCDVQYLDELKVFDEIEIEMRLDDLVQNRLSLRFDYYRVDGLDRRLVARGRQQVACMKRDSDRLRAVEVPAELVDALRAFSKDGHHVPA